MNTKNYLLTLALAGASVLPVRAATLYSEDFETGIPTVIGPQLLGGYGAINNVNTGGNPGGWQIQGGGGTDGTHVGLSVTTGVDNSGVGFSQALFANWDHSTSVGYTFDQETIYGAIAAPGAGYQNVNINIEMDIYISGSSGANPLAVEFENGSSGWDFTPTLTDGDWTHVSFTLDQASYSYGTIPFDPTQTSSLRVQFGPFGGFDFDAGNVVTLDNIVITSVPEPGSLALVGLGAAALALIRRRRS